MISNKYEQVKELSGLSKNDKVTVFDLVSGQVYQGVTVTYISTVGFDARSATRSAGASSDLSFANFNRVVVVGQKKPANWPPKVNDVWKFGSGKGEIWHAAYLGSGPDKPNMVGHGLGTGRDPNALLYEHDNKAELLYRHNA